MARALAGDSTMTSFFFASVGIFSVLFLPLNNFPSPDPGLDTAGIFLTVFSRSLPAVSAFILFVCHAA